MLLSILFNVMLSYAYNANDLLISSIYQFQMMLNHIFVILINIEKLYLFNAILFYYVFILGVRSLIPVICVASCIMNEFTIICFMVAIYLFFF